MGLGSLDIGGLLGPEGQGYMLQGGKDLEVLVVVLKFAVCWFFFKEMVVAFVAILY